MDPRDSVPRLHVPTVKPLYSPLILSLLPFQVRFSRLRLSYLTSVCLAYSRSPVYRNKMRDGTRWGHDLPRLELSSIAKKKKRKRKKEKKRIFFLARNLTARPRLGPAPPLRLPGFNLSKRRTMMQAESSCNNVDYSALSDPETFFSVRMTRFNEQSGER